MLLKNPFNIIKKAVVKGVSFALLRKVNSRFNRACRHSSERNLNQVPSLEGDIGGVFDVSLGCVAVARVVVVL